MYIVESYKIKKETNHTNYNACSLSIENVRKDIDGNEDSTY